MTWTVSGWHGSWFAAGLRTTQSDHTLAHTMACALYDDRATPDPSSAVLARYGSGGYAQGEQADAPGWPAGGRDLFNATGIVQGDRVLATADPAASASGVTVAPYGSMLYDRASTIPLPFLAFVFHYFGGEVASQRGIFTVQWAPEGIAVMGVPLTPRPVPPPLAARTAAPPRRRRKAGR